MPTITRIDGLIERVSFFAYARLLATCSTSGRRAGASSFGSDASISGVRLISHTTLPRHSTSIFWPGSSLRDVDLDRRAGGFRPLARKERHHERNRRRGHADAADDAGRADEEAALARVDRGSGRLAGHRLRGRLG